MQPTLYNPSKLTIITNGLNSMTLACEAQETLIGLIEEKLAASQLRCEELTARNARLEERHVLNQN